MRPLAYGPEAARQAQEMHLSLRKALKEVEMNGSKTVQIIFRKSFDPKEVAERVEFLHGPAPIIPVEMLAKVRRQPWKQPPQSEIHATMGRDSRKFVLKFNLPQSSGKLPSKLVCKSKCQPENSLPLEPKRH